MNIFKYNVQILTIRTRGGTSSLLEKLKLTLLDFFLKIIIKSIMVINFISTLSNLIHFIWGLSETLFLI